MDPQAPDRRSFTGPVVAIAAIALLALIIVNPFGGSGDDAALDAGSTTDGHAFSPFTFATVDGETTSLDEYSNGPFVVNYFAAWCPPCRAEIPAFQRVADEYAGEVAFVGISRDSDHDAWQSFVAETSMDYPSVFEGQGLGSFEALGGIGMPTTVFVDANGSVVETHAGALTEESLRDLIEEHFLG